MASVWFKDIEWKILKTGHNDYKLWEIDPFKRVDDLRDFKVRRSVADQKLLVGVFEDEVVIFQEMAPYHLRVNIRHQSAKADSLREVHALALTLSRKELRA